MMCIIVCVCVGRPYRNVDSSEYRRLNTLAIGLIGVGDIGREGIDHLLMAVIRVLFAIQLLKLARVLE